MEVDDSAQDVFPVLVVNGIFSEQQKEEFGFKIKDYVHNKLNVSFQIK